MFDLRIFITGHLICKWKLSCCSRRGVAVLFRQYDFVTNTLEFTVPKSKDSTSKKVNDERREGHREFTVPKSKDSTSQKVKNKERNQGITCQGRGTEAVM
jgi:hypothetical protein